MAIDFPVTRDEAGIGTGPLLVGDNWTYNSNEYTYNISSDGTPFWSTRGINVDPNAFIRKDSPFETNGGVISGKYNGSSQFTVSTADTATKVGNALTITTVKADGSTVEQVWDGSQESSIVITEGVSSTTGDIIARDGLVLFGDDGNELSVNNSVARKSSTSDAPTTSSGNYVVDKQGASLKAIEADRATKDSDDKVIANQDWVKAEIAKLPTNPGTGEGTLKCDIRNYAVQGQSTWDTAFAACLDANGAVYLPAGLYVFANTVGGTARSAIIFGDGSGNTILDFPSSGISFTGLRQNLDDWDSVIIKNIGLTYRGTPNERLAYGVTIEYPSNGTAIQKAYCEDVVVFGQYELGFKFYNTDCSTFNACSTALCKYGVWITSNATVETPAVNVRLNNWTFAQHETAVTVDSYSEGIYVVDSVALACDTGFVFTGRTTGTETTEPYYVIKGCNIDCISKCLVMDGVLQSVVEGNSFYRNGSSSSQWVGLEIKGNTIDLLASNNIFSGMSVVNGVTSIGIDAIRVRDSIFTDNVFANLNIGIRSPSFTFWDCQVTDNLFRLVNTRYSGSNLTNTNDIISNRNLIRDVVDGETREFSGRTQTLVGYTFTRDTDTGMFYSGTRDFATYANGFITSRHYGRNNTYNQGGIRFYVDLYDKNNNLITSGGGSNPNPNPTTQLWTRQSGFMTPTQSGYGVVNGEGVFQVKDQGTYIGWNMKVDNNGSSTSFGGQGATNFINNPGTGGGGWIFSGPNVGSNSQDVKFRISQFGDTYSKGYLFDEPGNDTGFKWKSDNTFEARSAGAAIFEVNASGVDFKKPITLNGQEIGGAGPLLNSGVYSILDPIFGGEVNGSWHTAFNKALQRDSSVNFYNGQLKRLLVPAGVYTCKGFVLRTKDVNMIGEGMGATRINFGDSVPYTLSVDGSTHKGQMVFANKGSVQGIRFAGKIKNHNTSQDHSVVLCFRSWDNAGNPFNIPVEEENPVTFGAQNDAADMDMPIIQCAFNEEEGKGGGGDVSGLLTYVGRNAYIFGCAFNTDGTALHLTFPDKPGSTGNGDTCSGNDSLGNDSQGGIYGWRRCQVIGCYFHLKDNSTCIVVRGRYQCRGLIIANNLADIGGRLLKVIPEAPAGNPYNNNDKGGGLSNASITGNTCLNQDGSGSHILFQAGASGSGYYENISITGNAMGGSDRSYEVTPPKGCDNGEAKVKRCLRAIQIDNAAIVNGLSISGNSFSYYNGACISIGGSNKKGVAITGNNMTDCAITNSDDAVEVSAQTTGTFIGNTYIKTLGSAASAILNSQATLVGKDLNSVS